MVRCAYCQTEVRAGEGRDVDIDQGTGAAPTITIHDRPEQCAPIEPVRRTPRPIAH